MTDMILGEGIARQELNLIFVVDTSGSMSGEKIGAVNKAIRDVMKIMPEIQEDTADADILVSALTFDNDVRWVYSEPKRVNDFKWNTLSADGGTNLSGAYDALAEWLTKRESGGQMPDLGGIAPIIILMTDGAPTSEDWEKHLASLRKKGWFRVALKYALAIEADGDEEMDVLTKFTGNSETVLKVYSTEALRQVIRVIAVTASKVKSNSSSGTIGGGLCANNNAIAQAEIAEKLDDLDDVSW